MFHPRRCGLFRTSVGSQLIGNTRQRTSHLQLCSPCFFKHLSTPLNSSQRHGVPRLDSKVFRQTFQNVPSSNPSCAKCPAPSGRKPKSTEVVLPAPAPREGADGASPSGRRLRSRRSWRAGPKTQSRCKPPGHVTAEV